MVALIYNWLLVITVRLVASFKFSQAVNIFSAVGISLNDDFIGSGTFHNTGISGNYTNTGVYRCFGFHTGSYDWGLCCEQRHGLALHV